MGTPFWLSGRSLLTFECIIVLGMIQLVRERRKGVLCLLFDRLGCLKSRLSLSLFVALAIQSRARRSNNPSPLDEDWGARLSEWLHEIKHDGYRLIVVRDGARVRLFTRNGHDWTKRYPLVVEAALRNRTPHS